MPTNTPHQTAKIYQFPIGGRASAHGLRSDARTAPERLAQMGSVTVSGEGWYHDAAIQQDAKRTRDH
ncbi:MAG: hypothetical protein JWQ94_897 [Tardiphaga sp.]|jgi:hypothetical protein|nr:hypothetical protein [Tardiphaga sp.]